MVFKSNLQRLILGTLGS